MKTPPPYQLVLFPRADSSEESQIASFELAYSLSKVGKSETSTFELIDFECDYQRFIHEPGLPDNFKNETYFIETSKDKFFKPGVISFVVNFDLGDLLIINTNFQLHKPDLRILLMVTDSQFKKWGMEDRLENIDCCIHQDAVNQSMMDKLHLISESHQIEH
jgi:hypothetical protein